MSWGEWQGYIALVVPERSDHWIHYLVRARWRWSRQSFFLTESGHIGLGPLGVLAGDIVSVFLGYYSTTVIRQVKEVEGPVVDGGAGSVPKHRIVGNSYVPGLNAGEAIFRRAENHETHTLVYIQEPRGGFNIYFRNPRTQIPQRSDPKLEKFFANPTLTRYPLDISESDPEFSALVNYWYPVSIQDLQRRGLQVGHITLI
jgi:hypothetical protein